MLPFNSNRWLTLKTFCNSGTELQRLVELWRDATGSPEAKALWGELQDYFLHQYSITDAAYAVIPHMVEDLKRLKTKERIDCLVALGVTELARRGPTSPPMPDDLRDDYEAAIERARPIAERCLARKLSKEDFRYLVAVICILRGHPGLGDLLVHLHAIRGECPQCGVFVYPKEIRDSGYLGN